MTLVFDERNNLQGQPGLHALIAGVSAYPHLPGGTGRAAPNYFGMQQLSSAALTAYKVYQWLLNRQRNLPAQLATCRLLLSPSPAELDAEPSLRGFAHPCTKENFCRMATDWRTDASSHKENVTLFYFVGHGVQRSKNDQILLLEDFGDGIGGTLDKSFDSNNLFYGMSSSVSLANMAETQFYFIDACRVLPSKFKDFERMTVPDVFDVDLSGREKRRATIFYAAVPDSKAYGLRGDQTIFSKALFYCLDRAGQLYQHEIDKWCVSVYSLAQALSSYIKDINDIHGTDQDFSFMHYSEDTIIHALDGPPPVDTILEIYPDEALPFVTIEVREIRDDQDQTVWELSAPLTPHPYQRELPAGVYKICARINPPNSSFVDYTKSSLVRPLRTNWKMRMLR